MLQSISDFIWGPVTPLIFAAIGLYFIVKLRFFGPHMTKYVFKNTVGTLGKKSVGEGLSAFSAMATALGGTIGVGNTVGVASAVISGGAGAVFWMITASFFGMAIKYAEIFLAVKYKSERSGGTMYFIEKGLNSPVLASIFAVVCVGASFGMGNMAQSNAVAEYMTRSFGVNASVCGIACAVITFYMICGGIRRIGKVSTVTVPLMAVLYIILGGGIILINCKNVPAAVTNILSSAFDFRCISGGLGGFFTSAAVRYGFSRGMFSNEAGMGSSPTAHASSNENVPQKQAVWGVFEVFADTVAVCGITALAIVTSDAQNTNPAGLVYDVFTLAYGNFGGIFLSVSIVFFALASIMCWYVYGQAALDYLCRNRFLTWVYRVAFCIAVFCGAIAGIDAVWDISDIFNGVMAFINLLGIVLLANRVEGVESEKSHILPLNKALPNR